MTGWQVAGWILIADVGIVTTALALGLGRSIWQAGDTRETSHNIFKGRNEQ